MDTPRTPEGPLGLLNGLNNDVLLNVCLFLDPVDSLQLAKTCRFAYMITIPNRFRAVHLHGFYAAVSFRKFLLEDPGDYCKYIRSLTFTPRAEDEALSFSDKCTYPNLAADIIAHTKGLRSLTVQSNHTLREDPQYDLFIDTVARLTDLTSLSLNFYMDSIVLSTLLPRMASRPRHVVLGWLDLGLFRDPRFPSFLSCVETLKLSNLLWDDKQLGLRWNHRPLPECEISSVRTLVVPNLGPDILARLSRLFPRVTRLRCQHTSVALSASWPLGDPQFLRWDSLDTLWYNALPPVAITTRAMHITRPLPYDPGSSTNYDYLRTLRLCTPTVLVIFMQRKLLKQLVRLPMLELRYLSLYQNSEIVRLDKRSDFNVASRLVEYSFVLHKLRFPLVGVCFHYNAHWLREGGAEQFEEDELRAPATKLAGCVPTLEYVGIKAGGCPEDRESSPDIVIWFRVVRSEQSTWVEKMREPHGFAAEERLLALDIR